MDFAGAQIGGRLRNVHEGLLPSGAFFFSLSLSLSLAVSLSLALALSMSPSRARALLLSRCRSLSVARAITLSRFISYLSRSLALSAGGCRGEGRQRAPGARRVRLLPLHAGERPASCHMTSSSLLLSSLELNDPKVYKP